MLASCRGELLVLRKRPATAVIGAIFVLIAIFFLSLLPTVAPTTSHDTAAALPAHVPKPCSRRSRSTAER